MLTIVSFIVVMGIVVFVHELGHLIAAKRNGIVVEEFGLGFPPRLVKLFERGGTIYSLNAIPFGGFARMKGEDDPTEPGSFAAASRLGRVITLSAGPAMNFTLAIIIFAILALVQGVPSTDRPATVAWEVLPASPAAEAGIRIGDRFILADDTPLNSNTDLTQYTEIRVNQPIVYTIVRGEIRGKGGETMQVTITPRPNEDGLGKLGLRLGPPLRAATIGEVLGAGFSETWNIVYMTFSIPANLIREGKPISDAGFMGPVGIAAVTGFVVEQAQSQDSFAILLRFIAALSTALGLTNLLPLPALDGGRLLFIGVEVIRRRRIEPAREGMVHLIGFGLLLVLVALMSVREISTLITSGVQGLGIR